MSKTASAFRHALTVRNVIVRYVGVSDRVATEFSSPEALKKYLHDHPDADKSNHTVKKPKGDKPSSDNTQHHAEAAKADTRKHETQKQFDDMKSLKSKVDNADPTAKKKFDRAYDKIYEQGETAAKAAQKLLPKLDEDSQQALSSTLSEWDRNKRDHAKGKGDAAHGKLQQAEQTWGYATQIDQMIADLTKS
jgi:hypothetical protein